MNADDPLSMFDQLFQRAKAAVPVDPNAMVLATADSQGRPSARVVLLKDFGPQGFVFYTNLESRKGRELKANPHAALCFHWAPLKEQVRIEGAVATVTDAEADQYFASRARGSQVGAWASLQSSRLDQRRTLEERVAEVEKRFAGKPVPRPPYWSGFLLVPERVEFWSDRPSRLHERVLFVRDDGHWRRELLYP